MLRQPLTLASKFSRSSHKEAQKAHNELARVHAKEAYAATRLMEHGPERDVEALKHLAGA